MPKRKPATFLLALALLIVSCDGGPTDPDQEPLALSGRLTSSETDTFVFYTRSEVVRFELRELRPVLIDVTGGTSASEVPIGFGLGTLLDDVCSTTVVDSMLQGDVFPFDLGRSGEFCVIIYDSGSFPQNAIFDYTLIVTR